MADDEGPAPRRRLDRGVVERAVDDLILTVRTTVDFRRPVRRDVSAYLQVAVDTRTAESWQDRDPLASGVALASELDPRIPGPEDAEALFPIGEARLRVLDTFDEDVDDQLEYSDDLAHVHTALAAAEERWDGRYLIYVDTVRLAPAWRGHRLGHLLLVEAVAAAAAEPLLAVSLIVGSLDEAGRNGRTAEGLADPGAARVGASWAGLGFGPIGGDGVAWFADPEELVVATREQLRERFALPPVNP